MRRMSTFRARGRVVDASRGETAAALAGVLVSNGEEVVCTGGDGGYTLPIDPEAHRFITITVPAGFRAHGRWYAPTAGWHATRSGVDFALRPAPERAARRFRMAQISDIHVIAPEIDRVRGQAIAQTDPRDDTPGDALRRKLLANLADHDLPSEAEFAAALQRLAAVAAPDCIVATGDLTQLGSVAQLQHYRAAVATCPVPLFSVFGGHDGNDERATLPAGSGFSRHYEAVLGPVWYSFDWGAWHFVVWAQEDVFLSPADVRRKERWLAADLTHQPADRPGALLMHTPPPAALAAQLRARYPQLRVVLHGHTHSSKVWGHDGLVVLETPSFFFGGIDTRPAGYRVVEFGAAGHVTSALYALPNGPIRGTAAVAPAKLGGAQSVGVLGDGQTAARPAAPERLTLGGRGAPLRRAWTWQIPGGAHRASPVVAGDVLLVSQADESYPSRSGVTALDLASGRVRWGLATDSAVKNSVAVAQGASETEAGSTGQVCVAVSVTGRVYAIDMLSGELRWQVDLPSYPDRWLAEAPVIANGVVYVGGRGGYTALGLETGEVQWHAAVERGDAKAHVAPVLWETLLIARVGRRGVAALHRANGDVVWEAPLSIAAHCAGMVLHGDAAGDVVLCAERGGAVAAIDVRTGAVRSRWILAQGGVAAGIAVDRGRAFATTSTGLIVSVDAATGDVSWEVEAGLDLVDMVPYRRGGRSLLAPPVLWQGVVVVAACDGTLAVLEPATGRCLERADFGGAISSAPCATSAGLGIATYDGHLHWYRRSDAPHLA
jgi:outer membrane protein assembly factor BamB/predicted phosphodiesterase